MKMKKILPIGLSIIISAGLLIPVNAAPIRTCQTGSQDQVKERTVSYKRNNENKRGSFAKYCTEFTKEQILERLNSCMEFVEDAHSEGRISDEMYDRAKEFLAEKIEKLENEDNETPEEAEEIEEVEEETEETEEEAEEIEEEAEEAEEETEEAEEIEETEDETPEIETEDENIDADTDNQTTDSETETETNESEEITNQGISAEEQQMVDLVNKARQENGLQPLTVDTKVAELARMKSKDMIDNNYFSHNSPTYGSPFEMLKNYGVSYSSAGENIAGNQTVENAHESLMNSPGHRSNILSSDYTHIGIGIQDGGPYGKMFTQIFIKK